MSGQPKKTDAGIATRDSWNNTPMPSKYRVYPFSKQLTKEQMDTLRKGYVPKAMEEKWFYYMKGNILYAHRSWTGTCVFTVAFSGENSLLTVNEEDYDTTKPFLGLPYSCKETVSMLIDAWADNKNHGKA